MSGWKKEKNIIRQHGNTTRLRRRDVDLVSSSRPVSIFPGASISTSVPPSDVYVSCGKFPVSVPVPAAEHVAEETRRARVAIGTQSDIHAIRLENRARKSRPWALITGRISRDLLARSRPRFKARSKAAFRSGD